MMSHPATPWIGLVAIVAMFVLPLLPAHIFEGPRIVKRYPRRVVCGDCGVRWTDDHECFLDDPTPRRPLQGTLHRVRQPQPGRTLTRPSSRSLTRRGF